LRHFDHATQVHAKGSAADLIQKLEKFFLLIAAF
jgi:hypothetical protein